MKRLDHMYHHYEMLQYVLTKIGKGNKQYPPLPPATQLSSKAPRVSGSDVF